MPEIKPEEKKTSKRNAAKLNSAIAGVLDPVVGALVHNAGSVLVILNSALLLQWRKKQG